MVKKPSPVRIGIAGWSNPPSQKEFRPASQSHLEHYAHQFSCVEINSSFYRSHRKSTYAAWKLATPPSFRFSVKMPRTITHDSALTGAADETARFFDEISALQPKLAVVLVQLPPSLEFRAAKVSSFFRMLPKLKSVRLVCEPRHASWFTGPADALLDRIGIARAATDPTSFAPAKLPGGNLALKYFRWHGSPRKYYSSYSPRRLTAFAAEVGAFGVSDSWCIFDNTAQYAAWENARAFRSYCELRDPEG
jgi:uncharacterized protein YecE (DUF72 family)